MVMRRHICGTAVVIALFCGASIAHAQQTTERYIPVGRSPGVSGTYSYIGEVEGVNAANRTITVRGPEGSRTISVTERTKIWLDRSELRQTNTSGSFSDLTVGKRVEVKYEDDETKDSATWIKVVISGNG